MKELTFADAIILAKGCHDYNGGNNDPKSHSIYHHGIQTVINVLEGAVENWDTQIATVYMIGKAETKGEYPTEGE